ncbi:FUSC family protein [Mesorhizobium sp. BR1-1-9]|uniref:FUSC family protein n=1 Tax=unclassified Mesorhizobium TaxID=325217 RepID=UPI001CD1399B|nr:MULTISPECIES: FUSC family protein [unclassified Mesorhizobium]MBZ9873247.1 FUSC family protein [Mesorhizobium sp. BR1-1-9]MBZ9944008.1 FUSC family protein [Mesorhizobium sp. BR1-1-13]
MTLPSWRDWLFSFKAFLASMLALYIALAFDLPRPYWAMAAVYVVANPLAGATSSKGLYRALGTLIGATASVILLPMFVNSPLLLSLVVAFWTGGLLYISMLDRTPRSYVFMLAGYTLPLIALPAVDAPSTIFDIATARSQEIILGIVCASVVAQVVFPMGLSSLLSVRVSGWLRDAANWGDEILRGEGAVPATPLGRQKLAADISGLDMLISQLAYDAHTRGVTRQARELRGRLMMLMPLFSSLADRLHALKAQGKDLPPRLADLLGEIAGWLAGVEDQERAKRFRAELDQLAPPARSAEWVSLILDSALARLREIVDLWHDCLVLRDRIAAGNPHRPKLAFRRRRTVVRIRHYDHGMMVFYAASAVAATLVASALWIYSGWAEGAGFVLMVAVACSFFAAQDRPAPLLLSMFIWCTVSLLVTGAYLFAILPMVHGFTMLALVLAPPFLVLGTLIPRPQLSMLAMLLTVNTASFIALGNRFSADFQSFAGGGIAALAGVGFALLWNLVTRPFGGEIAARRLVNAGWSDLAELAAGSRAQDHERLAGRMLDRLGQLVPRLASMEDKELARTDGYAEIRLGLNIVELQQLQRRLTPDEDADVRTVLSGVADLYRERVRRRSAIDPSPQLLHEIDTALSGASRREALPARRAVDALVGIRRALFPNAVPPSQEGELPAIPLSAAAE